MFIYILLCIFLLLHHPLFCMDPDIGIIDSNGFVHFETKSDVKRVLPIIYQRELIEKDNQEDNLLMVDFQKFDIPISPLIRRRNLKLLFTIAKEHPKKIKEKKNKLKKLQDCFIIADYCGADDTILKHIAFLAHRHIKCNQLNLVLRDTPYRYSIDELIDKNLIMKDDLISSLKENSTLNNHLSELGISFDHFMVFYPLIKEMADSKEVYTKELIKEKLFSQYAQLFSGHRRSYEDQEDISYTTLFRKKENEIADFIFSIENVTDFVEDLKNNPATHLNIAGLNIQNNTDFYSLIENLGLNIFEYNKILVIKANNNLLTKILDIDEFFNCIRLSQKHNNIKKIKLFRNKFDEYFKRAEKIELNLARNAIRTLPSSISSIINPSPYTKQFIAFKHLNLKNNPLTQKTRFLLRNAQYPTLFNGMQAGFFYLTSLYLFTTFPYMKMYFYLSDIAKFHELLSKKTPHKTPVKDRFQLKKIWLNKEYIATSALIPTHILFLSKFPFFQKLFSTLCSPLPYEFRYHLQPKNDCKKVPNTISYSKKNIVHELTEHFFVGLKLGCLQLHTYQMLYYRMYDFLTKDSRPLFILQ